MNERTYATVKRYEECGDYFNCITDDGKRLRIDLTVCGTLPEGTHRDDLIGKRVSWSRSSAFISIAHDVTIEPAKDQP